MDSTHIVKDYSKSANLIDYYANSLTEIANSTGDNLEGNCFTEHQTTIRNEQLLTKRINLFAAAKHGPSILEVGFNAGHSALLLLLGCNPGTKIDFLDIGGHPYVVPCYEYILKIRSEIPILLYLGNSKHILPLRVLKQKEHDVYDVIHMDGGHSNDCVVNDLTLCYQLCKTGGWLIVDDASGFILEEINRFLQLGLVKKVPGQLDTNLYPHCILEKI